MLKNLGFSVYLSTFDHQWPILSKLPHENAPVFLSLNMGKGEEDPERAKAICLRLAEAGFRVIADVSTETCQLFHEQNLLTLAKC